jgi:hypothetical protein
MKLVFKQKKQNKHNALADRVYAAIETGNLGQARTLLEEYKAEYPNKAKKLQAVLVREYGVHV